MNWTTEYPTKPGFYWIRNYSILGKKEMPCIGRSERTIAYVEKVRDGLSFWLFQWPDIFSRGQVMAAEWQGPIEPEREKNNRPEFKWAFPGMVCRDCDKPSNEFISWQVATVNNGPVFGIICRECWIKRLTPEQRKVYMV